MEKEKAAARGSCYNCGKAVPVQELNRRIEHRRATRFFEKEILLCRECAEEWDELYPEDAAKFPPVIVAEAAAPEQTEPAPEEAGTEPPVRLTRRQAERLAWYESMNKPLRGYSVRDAILRDDALGAEARRASMMGLSYGQMMARRSLAEQKNET